MTGIQEFSDYFYNSSINLKSFFKVKKKKKKKKKEQGLFKNKAPWVCNNDLSFSYKANALDRVQLS